MSGESLIKEQVVTQFNGFVGSLNVVVTHVCVCVCVYIYIYIYIYIVYMKRDILIGSLRFSSNALGEDIGKLIKGRHV